jgi:hypothetical protein
MKERHRSKYRANLPKVLQMAGTTIAVHDQKIPHKKILRVIQKYADLSGGLVEIYRQKVLPQTTRTIRLLGKKSSAQIIHTLLGYEVRAAYKRIQCPDLVTAQYIRLFSEIGCHSIKLPYDPTLTAQLIPEFEAAVDNINKGVRELFPEDLHVQHYVVRKIYEIIRQQLRFS